MAVECIGVVGSGTMGGGIAQVAAQAGFRVVVYDINQDILDKAVTSISGFIRRAVEKGKLSAEEAQATLTRLTTTTSLQDFTVCNFVIEAAPERLDLKRDLFQELETITHPDVILATNTSTLSVTQISAVTSRAERVVGMHFFNPAPLMPLVEVAAGAASDDAAIAAAVELARKMGKTPIVTKDVPGFIVNRVARPFYLEALRMLEEGIADHATLDRLIREGGRFRMGPFELMDLIGLDINFAASKSVYESYYYDPRHRPSLLQQRMVESGRLGLKTGRGWYDYSEGRK